LRGIDDEENNLLRHRKLTLYDEEGDEGIKKKNIECDKGLHGFNE